MPLRDRATVRLPRSGTVAARQRRRPTWLDLAATWLDLAGLALAASAGPGHLPATCRPIRLAYAETPSALAHSIH